MSFLSEFFAFMRARRKIGPMPIMNLTVDLGGLIVLALGSAVAPVIYTLF